MAEDRSLSTDLILSRLVADLADSARQLAQVTRERDECERRSSERQTALAMAQGSNYEYRATLDKWMAATKVAEGERAALRAALEQLAERRCSFNCDAESSCRCVAHEMYRECKALITAPQEP